MNMLTARKAKPYKGVGMEGPIATWYARNTATALPEFVALATDIAAGLDRGDWVLEVAPGPGYLAIELARLGLEVTGLDVSRSFVRIATEEAARAKVKTTFRQGDAADLPFEAESFDFVVCRAAFKNFSNPVGALREMRRVLRPGGRALLIDMRRDATDASIDDEVAKMRLGRIDAFMTRGALRSLRGRAYSHAELTRMVGQAGFTASQINAGPIGFEVRLAR
jgi:ubiquinone/menaquinone biosynthesis C-methylase UbiE